MPYVKRKYAHLEEANDNHMSMLKVSNQQLGQALQLVLRERDEALAQVSVLQETIARIVVAS